jgi:hypothetical protein
VDKDLNEKEAADELRLKRVEFYSVSLNAWYNSALELDKSLLTLSIAGLGFLLGLLISNKEITSTWFYLLFALSVIAFLTCLLSVLIIFNKNLIHIAEILNSKPPTNLEPYDKTKWCSFYIAIVFSVLTVVFYQASNIQEQNKKEEEKKMTNTQNASPTQQFESVNGVQTLAPASISIKSFNGVISVQPPVAAQVVTTSAHPTPTK